MPTRLGQNFLKNRLVLEKIIKAADLSSDDLVIEIGPGQGALTKELAKYAKQIIAIEKDNNLAEELAKNFKFEILNFKSIFNDSILNFKNKTVIISGDILRINLPELIEQNQFSNYKVVANIPYYITSPIIQLFLETEFPPQEMILMAQKEVAERICSAPGKMSLLAVSVQYYAQPELLFYVDKKAFSPVPEVNSAVIRIILNKKRPTKEDSEKFFRIARAGFCAKRKMLVNNLSNSLHLNKSEVEEKLKNSGFRPNSRAQELSVEDWKRLTDLF